MNKMRGFHLMGLTVLIFIIPFNDLISQTEPYAYNLQCEYLDQPIGIDTPNPRFTWKLKDSRFGARQSAYQVTVYQETIDGQVQIWDSGLSNKYVTPLIYEGPDLKSFTKYVWKLELWDMHGNALSPQKAAFETGMMQASDWLGCWITDNRSIDYRPASMFRRAFHINKPVESAKLYIASAGLHEIYINGERASEEFLNPAFTRYDKRILYNTYDVTGTIQDGSNAIGLILGNGWYNHQVKTVLNLQEAIWRGRPSFLANLRITFSDGSQTVIHSDEQWSFFDSPVVFNSIYASESYDFRKEIPNWNTAEFDDDHWEDAKVIEAPTSKIEAQMIPPIMRVDTLRPSAMKRLNLARYLFTFPKNIAGIIELKGTSTKGTKITIRHSEVITPFDEADNTHFSHVYPDPREDEAFHEDVIYLDDGPFTFSPKFNYKGFQYVEIISSNPIELTTENLVAYRINSDIGEAGYVNTSNQIVNKIWEASNSSYLSNMVGYPTDCPQREKNGWTGDAQIMAESGLYNFKSTLLYEKWLRDHQDAQLADGSLPMIIPASHWGYHFPAIDWTSSMIIIPWNVFLMTGDSFILEENYETMKLFHQYWESQTGNYLLNYNGFGDWQTVNTASSRRLMASAYYYRCTDLLSKIALSLGRFRDHERYRQIAQNTKKSFNDEYYKPAQGIYEDGTQTELAMAIQFGLVTSENENQIIQSLAKKIEDNNGFLDVGVLGSKVLLDALIKGGLTEKAFNMLKETSYPSWGFWIQQGLTTFPEGWNYRGWGFGASLNHAFFGQITAWMYKAMGGIYPSTSDPGFRTIELRPQFDHSLGVVDIWHEAPNGKIKALITPLDENTIEYEITIPPGSKAKLFTPDSYVISNFEDQHIPMNMMPGKNPVGYLELVSGTYRFTFSNGNAVTYPFQEINIEPESFGQLKLEGGKLYFEQGRILGISAQARLIDQNGRLISEYRISRLNDFTPVLDIANQLRPNQVANFQLIINYENDSQKAMFKRLLNNGN